MPGSAPDVEPGTIVLACADANAYLDHLTWSSWTASSATGVGDHTHNLCRPDCAGGRSVSEPAGVRLSYPIETAGGREFSELRYTSDGATFTGILVTSDSRDRSG
jgi:hypothetical protein